MEEVQNQPLFSLSIEPATKTHLIETAKWARFLAIVGFVFLALMVVAGIWLSTVMATSFTRIDNEYGRNSSGMFAYMGTGIIVVYIIAALIMFFPLLFLLRFASKVKTALAANDQESLNTSFQNLKAYFRYLGIITIIGLAFYGIGILSSIMAAAAIR
jgi:hypothetical protein